MSESTKLELRRHFMEPSPCCNWLANKTKSMSNGHRCCMCGKDY